ncbi:MAG: DUF484 family protein [Gammaproteobacteria bacterium]|nr:DUF484 family protein [Gammaproteobacteria bacterium]
MSLQKNPEYDSYEITEKNVVDFLETNPDFFKNHEETLLKLKISHHSGDAVSILEYQTEKLREQNTHVRKKLMELVNLARENDRLSSRVHQLTLSLIGTNSVDNIIDTLTAMFKKEFHADNIKIYLFSGQDITVKQHHSAIVDKTEEISAQFENFFKVNRPLCGRLKQQQLDFLFKDQADQVGSSVLIPLGSHGKTGMIAIGSHDHQRFHSSMGTVYLTQMSEIITQTIKRFINHL